MMAALLAFAGVACDDSAEDPADPGTTDTETDPGLDDPLEEDPLES